MIEIKSWKELAEIEIPKRDAPDREKEKALLEMSKIVYRNMEKMGFWGGCIDVSDWGSHIIVNGTDGALEVRKDGWNG